jgi:hypothetical protein
LARVPALGAGCRRFESCHLDHKKEIPDERYLFFCYSKLKRLEPAAELSKFGDCKEQQIWEKQSGGLFRRIPVS